MINSKNRLLAISLGLFIGVASFGQQDKCSSQSHWEKEAIENPNIRIKRADLEEFTHKYVEGIATGRTKKNTEEITIPVVVHVVYHNDIENISDQQIQSQIDVLNKDFNNENSDAITVDDETFRFYNEFSLGSNIRFQLASYEPNGTSTSGITRTYTEIEGFDEDLGNMYFTSEGGKDNWDPTKYLNIWVIALKEGSATLGWAQLPSDLNDYPATDGMVIRYEVFGTTGTAGSGQFSNNILGRTGTHEVGHWLNLKHTWGDLADVDSDCGSDFVDDTPPVEIANYNCLTNIHNPNSTCGTDERGEMYMNYMDYVDDACMYLFTEGQATRMRAAIEGARSGLLTSGGITSLNSTTTLQGLSIFPNPSVSGLFKVNIEEQINSIKVSDAYGRLIFDEIMNTTSTELDLSQYPNGVYYTEITSNGSSTTQKIVIQ